MTLHGSAAHSMATLVAALTLAGFCQGLTTSLFYELAAELLYPVREGMSAGILVLLLNASAGVLIFANSALPAADMNLIETATVGACLATVALLVKEEYKRPQDA